MDEFDFLRAMFRRLNEAEAFAADAKQKDQGQREDAWRTAALSLECSIKDYLRLRARVNGPDHG